MLNSFPIAVITGLLLGYLSGLGIGGGSLLILWLTLALNIPQSTARSINLMFFIAAAGAVSFIRWRKGSLDLPKILPAMIAGCVSAALFSWIGSVMDTDMLKKLFGILLLLTGLRELFYRPRKLR